MRKAMLTCLLMLAVFAAAPAWGDALRLSVTTDLEASGLLDVLAPEFKKDMGVDVQVNPGNLGTVIQEAMSGGSDVVFMSDPARQERLVARGFGLQRHEVMSGDFLIVGPDDDPAGAGGADAAACLRAIAASENMFVSRGDGSATHEREKELWKATGLPLQVGKTTLTERGERMTFESVRPEGMAGFLSIGDGMGRALDAAEEKRAYVLTDRVTYVRYKYGRPQGLRLEAVCEGDGRLIESYGIVLVNPEKQPHVRLDLAEIFARWLVSGRGQRIIADYRLFGRRLFLPDSKMAQSRAVPASGQ